MCFVRIDRKLYILFWKESLNSDGHQFHQWKENVHSPLILTELTEYKKSLRFVTLDI